MHTRLSKSNPNSAARIWRQTGCVTADETEHPLDSLDVSKRCRRYKKYRGRPSRLRSPLQVASSG
ncbi:hypothetical protein RMSM_02685 [Rhodopirellula maiorica SM1]|uniref:Uncharacterized protein n=1 Tax=Rhodopirellula maiorica SM1 TaxID=1265738 RepID=M5RM57_9BACT|nr:hypothetical protein RMSM_02685 [Rhodopirellula maiorica SM1]